MGHVPIIFKALNPEIVNDIDLLERLRKLNVAENNRETQFFRHGG